MARIIITETDEFGETSVLGWFDPARAERFDDSERWDGNNMVGVCSGSQWVDEYVFRTKGGRWVHNRDATRYHNGSDVYRFMTADEARDWLLRSNNEEALDRYFGPVEEERGPGRPAVGDQVKIAFPAGLLAKVDAAAAWTGKSRSEWVRDACSAALGNDR